MSPGVQGPRPCEALIRGWDGKQLPPVLLNVGSEGLDLELDFVSLAVRKGHVMNFRQPPSLSLAKV